MTDPRLDWRPAHDPRSRNYSALEPLTRPAAGSKAWRAGPVVLDQQREGGCVGWSLAHWLAASPSRRRGVDDTFAHRLYKDAQTRDPWPGDDYSGTSVLAGAKAAHAAGYITGYRWAFGADDLRRVLTSAAPAVIGIPWYGSMYHPDRAGLIRPAGALVGGHAILVRGYHPSRRLTGHGRQAVFTLRNSWGRSWGLRGDAYITFDDLAALLADDGEACIPTPKEQR